MDKFLETIAEPLADLMRAATNWLESQTLELPELDDEEDDNTGSAPRWRINERGEAVPS